MRKTSYRYFNASLVTPVCSEGLNLSSGSCMALYTVHGETCKRICSTIIAIQLVGCIRIIIIIIIIIIMGGKPTSFQVKYTCTYRGRTPELKITKNKTWAWQGQKPHSRQKHNKTMTRKKAMILCQNINRMIELSSTPAPNI